MGRRLATWRIDPLAVIFAALAGLYNAILTSAPTNDNFMHMALGRELLAGEVPIRDFFDSGVLLTYVLSAAAESIVGHRLLAEAIVVGLAAGVSTAIVFQLTRELTGNRFAAAAAAVLVLVAGPRGYSYPKLIVYAVAAWLWWRYVRAPERRLAIVCGAWTAAAFYFRPDHGIYVGLGVALALVAAHGVGLALLRRGAIAAMTAIVLCVPFLVFVQAVVGLRHYVATGFAQGEAEHAGVHLWPRWPLRTTADWIRLVPAAEYAPVAGLRWTASSSPDARADVLARYQLTPLSWEGSTVQRVRLSARATERLRELVNEPIVEDTSGIERGSASIPYAEWPWWRRWPFKHAWLRVELFGGIDDLSRASEAAAATFFALPVIVVVLARGLARQIGRHVTAGHLTLFAIFAGLVDFGLLRAPYSVRAVDGVVLPAILFGGLVAGGWRLANAAPSRSRRWVLVVVTSLAILFIVESVAIAGAFPARVGWLAGEWRSTRQLRGAWRETGQRLMASPPVDFWNDRAVPVPVRLAKYVRDCVPPSDRLLVLWFAPEIHYYSERLMAERHLVFVTGWAQLPLEQQLAVAKIERYAPPIALATGSLTGLTRQAFPDVVAYVEAHYREAARFEEDNQVYLILARADRPAVRTVGERQWPCYR